MVRFDRTGFWVSDDVRRSRRTPRRDRAASVCSLNSGQAIKSDASNDIGGHISAVFIMFYMSGPCVGYGPEPDVCNRGDEQSELNYTQVTRTIFAQQCEKKVGRWVPYRCDLETEAREHFNAVERVNPTYHGFTCKGFDEELMKPNWDYEAQLNVFRLARHAFFNWTNSRHGDMVWGVQEFGCHYHRNETTGRVVCVFCK
ncbi:hypothetical protein Y032_0003g1673 [Ancylostoma ceylanicum]|uniref:Uncharacterized protein n=1 Tax=Ancylostoma ceylanicum TaxID=53326 RepID=A0A016W015_9BILA|nr:hypothetical protein Y032_0003g1673 [Ancylostoma ceylanicum]